MHEHDISGLWCGLRSGGAREKRTCRTGSRHAHERAAIHQIAVRKFFLVVHRGSPLHGMWFGRLACPLPVRVLRLFELGVYDRPEKAERFDHRGGSERLRLQSRNGTSLTIGKPGNALLVDIMYSAHVT